MKLELPHLPYEKNGLEPYISAETIEYHHGKHHATYVKKYNELVAGSEYDGTPLLEVIRTASGPIFNNAAQAFNHDFYWKCLTPEKRELSPELADAINTNFGSLDEFKEAFSNAAATLFGSGWTWLVMDHDGNLSIENTSNADTPVQTKGKYPLLVCDVWEHAYYIDRRNARPEYIENFWHIVDWHFVSENFKYKSRL